MTPKTKTPEAPAAAPTAGQDLSEALALAIETHADEQVAVVRVFDDRYRCNWWVRDRSAHWLSGTTGAIRRSKFLRATLTPSGLQIEDLSDRR